MHILWHDGDSLGVDGAEVGVLEKTNHVGLGSLLEGKDGGRLESQVGLEVVGEVSDESLEWELSNEELGGLLVLSDVSEGDGTWSKSVGSLHAAGSVTGGFLGLEGDLLLWLLGSGRLSSGVLSSSHFVNYL